MKITNKLETVNKLQECEKRKEQFQKQLNALESHYLIDSTISFEINTGDFHHKGITEPIVFDLNLMIEYVKKELEKLQMESNKLIVQLSDIK